MKGITARYIRFYAMNVYEQLSLWLLLSANVIYTVALVTHFWFELPGIAWYGLWWAKFCDFLGECHIVPAFFTNEPAFYHLLQIICLLAWGGLGLAMYLLVSNGLDLQLPRVCRNNRNRTISILCFLSVFAMSTGLYLFYYIINSFPRKTDIYPQMNWAGIIVSVACGFEFLAGILILQVG